MCIYVGSSDINVVLPFSPLGDDSSGVVIIVSSALALTPFSILVSILVSTSVVSVVDVVSAGIGAAAPFLRGISLVDGSPHSGVVIIVSSALALPPFSILVSTSVVSVVDVVSAGIGAAAPFSRGIPCTGSFVNFTCKFCAIAVVTTENIEIIHINVQITRFIFTPLF